jgi:peptidase E
VSNENTEEKYRKKEKVFFVPRSSIDKEVKKLMLKFAKGKHRELETR